jgi:ribokinase
MKQVAVVGSLNCDLVMRVPRHPRRGETIIATSFDTFVGGKGNNQALACARAGARVSMIGRAGADQYGDMIAETLAEAGVDCEFLIRDRSVSTGVAQILIDAGGDNIICVAPQANARLPPELTSAVDLIVPNQTEAELLTGVPAGDVAGATEAAHVLQRQGAARVIVTMGEIGALVVDDGGDAALVPAFQVIVEDTTAAGDAFCGALVAALAAGEPLLEAALWGAAGGALACTRLGAEPSLPGREEIARLVAVNRPARR